MRALAFLTLLAVVGCRDRAVLGANGELRVSPERLDFPLVWAGYRATSVVTLENVGRRSLEVTLVATAPFEVETLRVVPAGDAAQVEIALTVASSGEVNGVLTVSAEGSSIEVPLQADARDVPACMAGDCRVSTFDPLTGACVEVAGNEGAACGRDDACVLNGLCRAGECVGDARNCDDGNACTVDTCSASKGCQYTERTCAAPTNPCEVPVCDPVNGCSVAPAVDGVSCGANDCITAQVCISGACVERPSPDGTQCAPATGCRAASTCSSGACVTGAPIVQQPAWRYVPPPERSLAFLGHVDNDGNVYATETWLMSDTGEVDELVTDLLSFTPTGTLRYRTSLVTACEACRSGVDFAIDTPGRRLFVKVRRLLIAIGLDDGVEQWRVDVTTNVPVYEPNSTGAGSFSISAPLLIGADGVGVPVMEGMGSHHVYVRVYDRATGALRWQFHRKGHAYSPGVTAAGELWLSTADCWAPAGEMARIAPDGTLLSARFISWTPSIYGDRSAYGYFDGKTQRLDDAYTFHDLSPALGVPYASGSTFVSGDQFVWLDGQHSRVVSANVVTGARLLVPEARQVTGLRLLRAGALGWAGQVSDGGYVRAVNADGGTLLDCEVSAPPNRAMSFVRGRLYAGSDDSLVVYETPGLDASPRGWVSERGSPERGGRAR
ncbi:MAG: hypothetical protein ACO1OB_34330 [Archangium sp.]